MKRAVLLWMERLTMGAATVVVTNSRSLRQQVVNIRGGRQSKVFMTTPGSSHGVDSLYFSPRPRDPSLLDSLGLNPDIPTVGFVGRLTHDKGIDALIEAVEALVDDGIAIQWLVVGDQSEPDSQAYARRLSETRGLVALVGAQQDVRPYFAAMDIHVLPSLREGFPNVVLEASAMGKPTVTTDATGAVDSVIPGKTGVVVPMRDPVALALGISRLVADDSIRRRMGTEARDWVVAEFQPTDVVSSLLGVAL